MIITKEQRDDVASSLEALKNEFSSKWEQFALEKGGKEFLEDWKKMKLDMVEFNKSIDELFKKLKSAREQYKEMKRNVDRDPIWTEFNGKHGKLEDKMRHYRYFLDISVIDDDNPFEKEIIEKARTGKDNIDEYLDNDPNLEDPVIDGWVIDKGDRSDGYSVHYNQGEFNASFDVLVKENDKTMAMLDFQYIIEVRWFRKIALEKYGKKWVEFQEGFNDDDLTDELREMPGTVFLPIDKFNRQMLVLMKLIEDEGKTSR